MELSIQQLRVKQKKRIFLRIFMLFTFFTVSAVALVVFVNSRDKNEGDDDTKANSKIHNICLTTDISATKQKEIKSIDLDKLNEKEKYDFKLLTTTQNEVKDKSCDTIISRKITDDSEYERIWSKYYLLVAKLDSPLYDITNEEFSQLIKTQSLGQQYVIWDSGDTNDFIEAQFNTSSGQAYPDSINVLKKLDGQVVIDETPEATDTTADEAAGLIAIIPFDAMIPGLKAISISDKSPLDKDFSGSPYPLIDSYWIKSNNSDIKNKLRIAIKQQFGTENYDRKKVNDVIITGNSAIGARAYQEVAKLQKDPTYPILGIADTLREASVAQIHSKSVFSENCVQSLYSALLCGDLDSYEQLTLAGIDVVSLSGESVMDTGREDFESTLGLLKTNEVKYYAGGSNFAEAHKPLIIELGQLKVAFLGYNFLPPFSYGAGKTFSGNSQYTTAIMQNDVKMAKDELGADFVFVDMNWGSQSQKSATNDQIRFANETLSVGADVITGYNPLYVNDIILEENKAVFYALGNTLYAPDPETRENQQYGLMVRHIFYDKKYLGFELIPTIIDENYQTRLLVSPTKDTMLKEIFTKSSIKLNLPVDSNDLQSN